MRQTRTNFRELTNCEVAAGPTPSFVYPGSGDPPIVPSIGDTVQFQMFEELLEGTVLSFRSGSIRRVGRLQWLLKVEIISDNHIGKQFEVPLSLAYFIR